MRFKRLAGLSMLLLLAFACLSVPSVAPPTSVSTGAPTPTERATSSPTLSPTPPPTAGPEPGFALLPSVVNRDPSQGAQNPSLAIAGDTGNLWISWAEDASGGLRQIFVDEVQNDEFLARGGTLNVHLNVVADQPTITFAGSGRTVPWVAWNEPSPGFGNVSQVFASRFNSDTGLWQVVGQDRGGAEPSINLNTNRPAEHAFIVGGTIDPANPPTPWVAWEEQSPSVGTKQIFVAKGVKDESGIGGFRWQMVGSPNRSKEPTLNVDRRRDAHHPSVVFAGAANTTPWVTWYEDGAGRPSRVFAARGVVDPGIPGGARWETVPACGSDEAACTLNTNPLKNGQDPTIAAGSLNPSGQPVPWIAWSEVGPSGKSQVFVSRLDPTTRNSFLNVGSSLNVDQNHDAKSPLIAFVGNVPYVAWTEDDGNGTLSVHVRHLSSDPQTGTWSLDSPPEGFSAKTGFADLGLAIAAGNRLNLAWTSGDPGSSAPPLVVGQLQP